VTAGEDTQATEPSTELVERIAERARGIARERLREALDARVTPGAHRETDELDDELLDQIADEEADVADGPLRRVAIGEAIAEELGMPVREALEHPTAARAEEVLRAAARQAETRRQPALLVEAVHVFGIESVPSGDRDIELRLADTGIDVRRPSTGSTIGRLRWDEVRTIALQRPRWSTGGPRRFIQLVAVTDRGEVTFELVGLSDEEVADHLEPLIARNCAGFRGGSTS
jgi:hypothetical protein